MSVGASSNISTGRGGAGNIGSPRLKPVSTDSDSLTTPHLKAPIYTTGRGGQGNMAKWEANESRRAQDVEPVVRKHTKAGTTVLTGRGGGGNVHRVVEDDDGNVKLENSSALQKVTSREGRPKERQGSFIDKAKEGLAKLRASSGSAQRHIERKGGAVSSSSRSSTSSK